MKLRFGHFELDTGTPELFRDGAPVQIEPKVLDILVHLAENHGQIISKDGLIETVWNGRIVSDAAVTSRINLVRQAVGDDGRRQEIIQTLPKRGFRFVAEVEIEGPSAPDSAQPMEAEASILVLPFTDLTPDQSGFLAEGLTEDLIVALSRYGDVRVVSLGSALRIKERQSWLENPMAEVPTDYMITGTVQVRGNRVRVTVQLSERATGASICAEQFDRELRDYFEIQDEIVKSLAGCLPWRVLTHVGRRLTTSRAPRLSSYQAFVRAGYDIGVHGDIGRAEAAYRDIVRADHGFGPARAALAFLLGYKVFFTGQQTDAEVAESLDHGRAAIRLSADNERVLAKCAMVFQFAAQFSIARKLAEQAIRINPNSTDCTHFLATILTASGEAEKAVEYHRQTMLLDPLFPEEHYEGMIEAHFVLGDYDFALDLIDRWSDPARHILSYGAACAALAGQQDLAADFAGRFAETAPPGYSNAAFVSALLRYHKRPEDRLHWLEGFEAGGIPEMDKVRASGIADA
ncbi:MAG: winged helix-turn-helix domain-containing protein [Silicimonas sp.]|nr:winged helix-turn-helix domain-containing protein [Silicimonas sp.]